MDDSHKSSTPLRQPIFSSPNDGRVRIKRSQTSASHAKSSHTRTGQSRPATKRPAQRPTLSLSRDTNRRIHRYSRRIILILIPAAMAAVVVALVVSILNTPDRAVPRTIEALAKDYYENYFYESVGAHNNTPVDRAEILARYAERGFTTTSLKQLLYFDDGRHLSRKSYLETYCNIDHTNIRIYPDAPFGPTDYHVEYNYSCDFE